MNIVVGKIIAFFNAELVKFITDVGNAIRIEQTISAARSNAFKWFQ